MSITAWGWGSPRVWTGTRHRSSVLPACGTGLRSEWAASTTEAREPVPSLVPSAPPRVDFAHVEIRPCPCRRAGRRSGPASDANAFRHRVHERHRHPDGSRSVAAAIRPSWCAATALSQWARAVHCRCPDGATRIDGRGKFLMPGMAEMHAHIPGGQATDALHAARPRVVRRQRRHDHPRHARRSAASCRCGPPSPRARSSDRRSTRPGPSFNDNTAKSPEVAMKMVQDQKAAGYDLLKIHPGVPRAAFDAMAATANKLGHSPSRDTFPLTLARARAVRQITTPSITSTATSNTRCDPGAPVDLKNPGLLRRELRRASRSRAAAESRGGYQGGRRLDCADAGPARDLHEPGDAR